MLINIGRYSEMTYVFETLKQNHQFELLFRKGRSKVGVLPLNSTVKVDLRYVYCYLTPQ